MIHAALTQYRFLEAYAERLLAGLNPADAHAPAHPGGHHPAWILGHLTFSGLGAVRLLGGDAPGFEDAQARFGIGTTPGAGGDFDAILAGWRETHRCVGEAIDAGVPEQRLAAPNPIEAFADAFATVGDQAAFLLTGHEAVHLGQLSAWRRARGGAPLF